MTRIFGLALALSACAPARAPVAVQAQAPAAGPCTSFTQELASADLELHVSIADMLSWPMKCDAVPSHVVSVELDGKPLGDVELECNHIIRAPPPRYALPVVPIKPGRHELHVVDREGKHDEKRRMSLPGLELSDDGTSIDIAEHVLIWLSNDELRIDDAHVGPIMMVQDEPRSQPSRNALPAWSSSSSVRTIPSFASVLSSSAR